MGDVLKSIAKSLPKSQPAWEGPPKFLDASVRHNHLSLDFQDGLFIIKMCKGGNGHVLDWKDASMALLAEIEKEVELVEKKVEESEHERAGTRGLAILTKPREQL